VQVHHVIITTVHHSDDRWVPSYASRRGRSSGVRPVSSSLFCCCGIMLRSGRSHLRHCDGRSWCPGGSHRLQYRLRSVQRRMRCSFPAADSVKSSGLVRSVGCLLTCRCRCRRRRRCVLIGKYAYAKVYYWRNLKCLWMIWWNVIHFENQNFHYYTVA